MSMAKMRQLLSFFLFACFASISVYSPQAHLVEYSTPLDGLLLKSYPMHELSDCGAAGDSFSVGATIIKIGDAIELHGTMLTGSTWDSSVEFSHLLGCYIFASDINGDGQDDVIIVTYGGDSSGGYDTALTLFLIDRNGNPLPWRMTGYLRADENGIKEIAADKLGKAIILRSTQIGHPAWGGVSKGYSLFRVNGTGVEQVRGEYMGITWPFLPNTNPDNLSLSKIINSSNLATDGESLEAHTLVRIKAPILLRYGLDTVRPVVQTDVLTAGQYPKVDANAVSAAKKHLTFSDGSHFDLPTILVADDSSRNRRIIFNPVESELSQLWKTRYRAKLIGTDCTDVDDCHPLLLWATEESTKR